jgi:predicted AAA+ superfamily ATPase
MKNTSEMLYKFPLFCFFRMLHYDHSKEFALTLRRDAYRDRLLDGSIERLLCAFGAVEIVGAMWCGKTWMAEAHGNSKISIADFKTRELVKIDHGIAFEGDRPHIIDEWQDVPELWDETRLAVDAAADRRGLFILTGSSTPNKEKVTHSGSGRIARLHLRPMSLYELGASDGTISLSGLFEGQFKTGKASSDLRAIAEAICKGGWPGTLTLQQDLAALVPAQYLDTFLSVVPKKGVFDEQRVRRLLISLARNLGQAASYHTLASDMVEGNIGDKRDIIARQQVEELLGFVKDRFIIEDLPGWDAPVRSRSRVRTKPRRTFVDPSLAASLLGASPGRLLADLQLFGRLFEELCVRDLRVYASTMDAALPNSLRYYRDSDGLETDAIIELRDGRWAALEFKLGDNKVDEASSSLLRLKDKVAANPMAKNPEPSFMAVLVAKADYRYRTPDGIFVFPLSSLTA